MFKCTLILLIFPLISAGTREKRFLTFPPTAPTRNQLIVGIGVPFESGENVDVISGWVLKSEYNLPINSSDLKPVYFPGIFAENGIGPLRKRREVNERYDGEITVVNVTRDKVEAEEFDDGGENYWYDNDENDVKELRPVATGEEESHFDPDKSRWAAYKMMETIVKSKGYQGKACVLRAICEAANAPFTHSSGLLGEVLHIIMSPSTSSDVVVSHTDNEYFKAEQLGQAGAPCDHLFPECSKSLLSIFTDVYDPLTEFIESIL